SDEYSEHSSLRFNSINPGPTRTKMRAKAYPAEKPTEVPEASSHANRYIYLLGPASQGVTGQQFQAQANPF
ncbi:MAG TPA: YciK family oxidoreductase, partial [Marinagarivorans sp.]